jgi:hypothetical protein
MTAMTSSSVARKRILCVEDDEDTGDMMNVLLGGSGYEAVIAASVSDALESARSGGLALCILDPFDSHTPIMFYSTKASRLYGNIIYYVVNSFDRPGQLLGSRLEVVILHMTAQCGGPARDVHIDCIRAQLLVVQQLRGYVLFNIDA